MSLHKSVTVITGEAKGYQEKFKEFGINYDFWKSNLDKLRNARNRLGIAHCIVTEKERKQLRRIADEAFETTKQTILKYANYLRDK